MPEDTGKHMAFLLSGYRRKDVDLVDTKQEFMRTKPVFRMLVSMAVPMMLSMFIQSLYNIVDSIYVAKLGTDALTAVSLAFPLQNALLSVSVGIGVGINSAIAINLGAKKYENANKAATIGMFLTLIHCVLFVIFGLLITHPFLSMFTKDVQTMQWASQYTYIVLCCSFGQLLQIAMEKIFQAIGDMTTTMLLMGSGCIINIILDPIFIFVLKMEVAGAAVATVIGQICAFFLYIIVYKKKRISVQIHRKYLCFDKAIIKQIYFVGIPSSIMLALPSVLVGILNGILAQFNQVYVAVLGIYFKLQTFIYMPASGVVQGMRPIVSYNYGAGEIHRVKKTVNYSLLIVAVIMLIGTIGALAFPQQILTIFNSDSKLIEYGVVALQVISLGFLVSSVGVVYSGTFEALGKGKESLTISLLRQFVIIIPLGFLLSQWIGPLGIWISFPISECIATVVAYILLRCTYRKYESQNSSLS